jgi:hypothetical protein
MGEKFRQVVGNEGEFLCPVGGVKESAGDQGAIPEPFSRRLWVAVRAFPIAASRSYVADDSMTNCEL